MEGKISDYSFNAHRGSLNPQSGMTISRSPSSELTTSKIALVIRDNMDPLTKAVLDKNELHIALVISDTSISDVSLIRAIRNPVSTCRVDTVVVLNENNRTKARHWLENHGLDLDMTQIRYGDEGFQETIQSSSIQGVYVFLNNSQRQTYVLQATQHGKHVLVKDPESTPYHEFLEYIECAAKHQTFLQFATMFVHLYTSQTFLRRVTAKSFGKIQYIDAILEINYNDLDHVYVAWPKRKKNQGCIQVLARFCVLIATLILENERPIRATVIKSSRDPDDGSEGEPLTATCQIDFTNDFVLHAEVGYTPSPTRQVLTIESDAQKEATMTDFVIPHPDRLATYRLYEKAHIAGELTISEGECLDVPMGVSQNVELWREFHRLCNKVAKNETAEARRLSRAAIHTKLMLIALNESYRTGTAVDILQYEE